MIFRNWRLIISLCGLFVVLLLPAAAMSANAIKPVLHQRCSDSVSTTGSSSITASVENAFKDNKAPRIFYAIGKDRHTALKKVLQSGDNPNICYAGFSPLQLTVGAGDLSGTSLLLEAGAHPDLPLDSNAASPLFLALSGGHYDVATLLLNRGAKAGLTSEARSTPLHELAKSAAFTQTSSDKLAEIQITLADRLLKQGISPSAIDSQGVSPLMWAAIKGNANLIAFLLYKGADIDQISKSGSSAASLARKFNHVSAVLMLEREPMARMLRAGRTAEFINALKKCNTPEYPNLATSLLQSAVTAQNSEAILALTKCGADVNERFTIAGDGGTPVQTTYLGLAAATVGSLKTVQTLVQAGADISSPVGLENGKTTVPVLSLALSMRRYDIAKYLIYQGASTTAKDPRIGNTPLMDAVAITSAAERQPMLDIAKQLIKAGADIHARNDHDMTALHLAAMAGNAPAVEILLNEKANPNDRDNRQRTPLFYAQESSASSASSKAQTIALLKPVTK